MANAAPLINRIYIDLEDRFKGIADAVFLGRPKMIKDTLGSFIVIELPSRISDLVAGEDDFSLRTWGSATLYVRSKPDSTLNVTAQSRLAQAMRDLFPIRGEVIVATKPTVQMLGYDGYGFNATLITFKLRTLININN